MRLEDRKAHARQARVVVGVDAGKLHHALVVRPQVGPAAHRTGKPFTFPVTADGFDAADRHIRAAVPDALGVASGEVLVGIEFGGTAGYTFAAFLVARGYDVVSVRPVDTKNWTSVHHRRALKTDAHDAAVICALTADGNYLGFPFLKPIYAELRYLVSAIDRATKVRTASVNRLRGALHIAWPEFERQFVSLTKSVTPLAVLAAYPSPAALLAAPRKAVVATVRAASRGQRGEELADQLRDAAARTIALPSSHGALYAEIPLLLEQIAVANRQREIIEAEITRLVDTLPEAAALLTVPGLNSLTVGVFLGSVGDVHSYDAAGQVIALAGLDLTEKSSGKHVGAPHISKHGRPVLRKYLFLAALREVAEGRSQHAWYRAKVQANGGRGKPALIAIARRQLRTLYAIARSGQPYDPAFVERRRAATRGAMASER